jgi:hypothetical protein
VQAKDLTAVFMIIALAAGFATESAAEGTCGAECSTTPGTEDPEPKGNNGWGNGSDEVDGLGGTNNGSFTGGTAVTKSVNGLGPDRFDEKFVDGR